MKYLTFNLFLLVLCLLASNASANCTNEDENCIETKEWRLSVAIGAGVLTNPLHGGENFPLVVIPYFSYYGDNIFLENNVLGYTLEESNEFAISLIGQLNREAAYFSHWQVSQFLLPNYAGGFSDSGEKIDISQVKTRRWAIDAGLQLNWFPNKESHIELQLLHDINSVYNGLNAHFAFHHAISPTYITSSRLVFTLGLNWQSKDLIDYYYNDQAFEQLSEGSNFQAKANFNPYLKLGFTAPIAPNWQVKLNFKREFLGNNLRSSPLVEDKTIDLAYIGLVYAF